MEIKEQIRCMKLLMQRLDDGTNVDAGGMVRNPVDAYISQERALHEWETMFQNYPQVMGLTGDLPKPGSFLPSDDLGKPMLMTRDKDGKFHAFLNVCSHRGTVVESETRGKKNIFNCPFHAWGYSGKGDLVSVPKEDHFGPVDKSCNGLVKLTAEEKHGLLWVHPKVGAEFDLEELLGDLGDELDSWGYGELQFGALDTYETPMNWKLAIDTFGETYHFSTLHRNSLFLTFHANVQAYDTYGRNHRMTLVTRGIDALRDIPEENWRVTQGTFPVYYLFPNIQLNVAPFGFILFRVYPDPTDPTRKTISRIGYYARPEMMEKSGEQIRDVLTNFSNIIHQEDYAMAARSQLGAEAGVPDHTVFGRNEPALHHYHNTYREALGMEKLQFIAE